MCVAGFQKGCPTVQQRAVIYRILVFMPSEKLQHPQQHHRRRRRGRQLHLPAEAACDHRRHLPRHGTGAPEFAAGAAGGLGGAVPERACRPEAAAARWQAAWPVHEWLAFGCSRHSYPLGDGSSADCCAAPEGSYWGEVECHHSNSRKVAGRMAWAEAAQRKQCCYLGSRSSRGAVVAVLAREASRLSPPPHLL